MESIPFPNISPVAFSIFGFSIYWYALAYIFGILLGYVLLKRLNKIAKVYTTEAIDDLTFYCTLGIIIGGRLGFILFYGLSAAFLDPIKVFMIRDGGMSFHGGLLGMIVAVYLVARKYKIPFLSAMDLISCVAPIGLFSGRVANFINAEMYGKVTSLPWGVIFPGAGALPRHATQIYEALTEGIILLSIMLLLFPKYHKMKGVLSGIFLIYYAVIRSSIEVFKEPLDGHVLFLTTGQALCIPMLICGFYLLLVAYRYR
jgi:phosphatidylglycerol:prolipoprotein diacylglycerol transferase